MTRRNGAIRNSELVVLSHPLAVPGTVRPPLDLDDSARLSVGPDDLDVRAPIGIVALNLPFP